MQGPLGKNSISPPAAHVRTMRKGSTDHLVLNIASDSDPLLSAQETDDKGLLSFQLSLMIKMVLHVTLVCSINVLLLLILFAGHVFKSLNASGIIPKQGKTIADRVDGIW